MTTELNDDKLKDLIAKPENRIKLHDLVHEETEKLYAIISKLEIPANNGPDLMPAVRKWLTDAEVAVAPLVRIFAYGCYFGTPDQAYLWQKTLNRLTTPHDGTDFKRKLELYPAMLISYAGGVSATLAKNGPALKSLIESKIQHPYQEQRTLFNNDVNGWLLDPQVANQILELENHKTPLSDHVHDFLVENYPQDLANKSELTSAYDYWEIIAGMAVAHYRRDGSSRQWAPVGRFAWRREKNGVTQMDVVGLEIDELGSNWTPFLFGMFGGSVEMANDALNTVRQQSSSLSF